MPDLNRLSTEDRKKIENLKTHKEDAKKRLAALDISSREIGGYLDIDKRFEAGKAKIRRELIEIEEMEKQILFEHFKDKYGSEFARKMTYSIE